MFRYPQSHVFLLRCHSPPIRINRIHRIIPAIRIRADVVVLLAQRVHPVPARGDGVVLPCAVVVGVQAVHLVQFLAVVPLRLHVAVRRVVAELQAGGVVFHPLHDRPVRIAVCLDHLPHAAEVVTVEVVEREGVLNGDGGVFRGLAVALVELVPVNAPVPQRKDAAEQVVRGVRGQYFRRRQFPGRTDGDGDVRHRREVRHAQFLSPLTFHIHTLVFSFSPSFPPHAFFQEALIRK